MDFPPVRWEERGTYPNGRPRLILQYMAKPGEWKDAPVVKAKTGAKKSDKQEALQT